jgi:serine/threonine protein phosphatase PrpC
MTQGIAGGEAMTRLTVAMKSDPGRVRGTNEDSVLAGDLAGGVPVPSAGVTRFEVGPRGALLALSDGMGGHKAGEVASTMTLESLFRALTERAGGEAAGDRVRQAVEKANEDVFKAGRRPSLADMGATLTAVLVTGAEAYVAEVGDSRAYVLREGVLHQMTEDQNLAQVLARAGQLTPEEANASQWRSVLLQAIGHTLDLKISLGKLSLRQRDLLVLCSDGLTTHVTNDEVRDAVLAAPTVDMACERLIALANDRGGTDNVTVLLAGVAGDLPRARQGERIVDTYRTLRTFEATRDAGHAPSG